MKQGFMLFLQNNLFLIYEDHPGEHLQIVEKKTTKTITVINFSENIWKILYFTTWFVSTLFNVSQSSLYKLKCAMTDGIHQTLLPNGHFEPLQVKHTQILYQKGTGTDFHCLHQCFFCVRHWNPDGPKRFARPCPVPMQTEATTCWTLYWFYMQ